MALGMWDSNTSEVAWLQGVLASAGYDPGPIDGVYGPRTAAAVAAWQAANGLPATGIFDDASAARIHGVTGSTSTANPVDIIRSKYGHISWAYDVAELKPIFDQAVRENWDEARIIGAISATTWWKTTAENARQWQEMVGTDPAEAQRQRDVMATQIRNMATQLGVSLDGARLQTLTEDALKLGAGQQEITAWLVNETRSGYGTLTAGQDSLRAQAANYAVPVSDQTLATWAAQIATGQVSPEGWLSYLKETAKSMFPTLSAAIDSGISVRQYAEPYVQIASQELGLNSSQISLNDAKWQRALTNVDQDGNPTAMSLYDWTRLIRTDAQYGFDKTPGAVSDAVTVKDTILKAMGFA